MSEKDRRVKSVEHVLPTRDKRAERRAQDLLRRPHDVDEDWDDYDFVPTVQRFKKSRKLE